MAKIVVRLPEPKPEYDISNQKQINRALTTVVEQLNSTFLETEKEEQQRFNFFYRNGKCLQKYTSNN